MSSLIPFNKLEKTVLGNMYFARSLACFKFSNIKVNNINGLGINSYGDKFWYKNCKYHRLDGPAIEYINGDKYWFKNGLRHRLDGPAIEHNNGAKKWFKNGLIHREDGPAIIYAGGEKYWYKNGVHHRDDGPASITANGRVWYKNGIETCRNGIEVMPQ